MAHADVDAALAAALDGLARLKHQYERHWQGLERPEPEREREALRGTFRRLLGEADGSRQTALAFRIRSAQASFRAFDELCERRGRDPAAGRARHLRRGPEAATGPVATEAPLADAVEPLYRRLLAAMEAHGRPAPPRDKFQRQVEAALQTAARAAPGARLRPELQVTDDGRLRLLVVDADPA